MAATIVFPLRAAPQAAFWQGAQAPDQLQSPHLHVSFAGATSVTAPRIQHAQPVARGPTALGCLGVIGLVLCVGYVLVVGAAGGLVAYGFAYSLGTPSWGASIAGGVVAFCVACLTAPVGAGLFIASGAMNRSPAESILGFVVAAVLAPIIRSGELLLFATLTAVIGGLLLWFCPPVTSSILLAFTGPLFGLGIGAVICSTDGNYAS
jgi:hypothetical protein